MTTCDTCGAPTSAIGLVLCTGALAYGLRRVMLEMLELAKAAESDDPKLSIAFTALGCAAFLLFLPTFLLFMAAGGALLVAIVNI